MPIYYAPRRKDQTLDSVLQAIATRVNPDTSLNPTVRLSGLGSVCHTRVADTIRKRENFTDVIWVYGWDKRTILHSVLTDSNNRIVCDALGSQGEFFRTAGYKWQDGTVVPLMQSLTVRDWANKFFLA